MLRRGPDTHRRLARPFAAPRPYRADRRRELPPQGQAKSRKYQSKKLEFGTPGWVSFTPTIPTKVGQISTGVDNLLRDVTDRYLSTAAANAEALLDELMGAIEKAWHE